MGRLYEKYTFINDWRDAVQMRERRSYLDIMWKPEEKDVEDQLGTEQAK